MIAPPPSYFEVSGTSVHEINDFVGFMLVAGFFGLQIASGYLLWKAYVVGSPTLLRGVSVLGLNDHTPDPPTPTYSEPTNEDEPAKSGLTALRVYLYLIISMFTFTLGVLAFEAVHRFI